MFNLNDKNLSYIIISPEKKSNISIGNRFLCDKLSNILYSKDYTLFPITAHHSGLFERSFLAISSDNNNTLRKDAIFLIDEFEQDSIIIKYKNENMTKSILKDGSERVMKISYYDSDFNNKSYIYNGISFSFTEEKQYHFLTDKKQLKSGMIVEFYNDDRWVERKIQNPDIEYEKMYKLLIKYNKLRTLA